MAYTDFFYTADGRLPTAKDRRQTHWDIAISCYEPLEMVTGGIGTYTRLLIDVLSADPRLRDKKIALFCRKATASLKAGGRSNLQIFEIPESWEIYGKPAERIGNEHDWYSWNLAHFLLDLTRKNHSFGFFEFSDYAVESYFPLKMRRAGLLNIDIVGVRLHSPELMLFRDNQLPARTYDPNRLTRIARELFCYKHCDKILYGAPAMLERVAQECRRFGVEILSRAAHIEHPYPVHDTTDIPYPSLKRGNIHLGYIGRLEIRKGILHFLRIIAESDELRKVVTDLDIVFELFGADCTDHNDRSVRSQILALHTVAELRGRIVAHGYMSQEKLNKKIRNLDGFIFPSLFENYPNALLEVLHTDKPVLISEAGGMPYISRDLPGIYRFSYNHDLTRRVSEFFCSIRRTPTRPTQYFAMAKNVNTSIAQSYASLTTVSKIVEAPKSKAKCASPGVDFVIPFFNDAQHVAQSLRSVKAVMSVADTLCVVDDVSSPEESSKLEKIMAEMFGLDPRVRVHKMAINSGPSVVRNVGARMGANAFVQFLDADDYLNPTGYLVTKQYLEMNDDVDFVYGIQDNFGARSHVWVPRDSSVMTCLDENYTHSAILITRLAFEGSGGFDAEMRLHFEDWQFNCKLAFAGYRGEVVPFVSQHYRVREGSRTFRNLEREAFSRDQVIGRSCMNRLPQQTMFHGELLELIGKYSSLINGRWRGNEHGIAFDESLVTEMSLADLCNLEGEAFVRAAYGVVLGRSADEAGLKFYMAKLEGGVRNRNIIADMLASSEMRSKRRTLPAEYYRNLRLQRLVRYPKIKQFLLRKRR